MEMGILNNPAPHWLNNTIIIVTLISILFNVIMVIKHNIVGRILQRKQRKKYKQIIGKLNKQLEEFWSKDKPNINKLKKITETMKELSVFISTTNFHVHPGDYRSFLYDFLTMDVEDYHIFQLKKKCIEKHSTILIGQLKRFEKYIY